MGKSKSDNERKQAGRAMKEENANKKNEQEQAKIREAESKSWEEGNNTLGGFLCSP